MQSLTTKPFRSPRRRTAVVIGTAVAASLALGLPPLAGEPAQAEERKHPWAAEDGTTHITLVTGDRVTIRATGGHAVPEVDPAEGRESMGFRVYTEDGNLHVLPTDAASLIAQGVLDERLFDVTSLVAQGYADDKRDDVPLLVRGGDGFGVADTRSTRMDGLDIAITSQPKSSVERFWSSVTDGGTLSDDVTRIWLDGKRELTLDTTVPQIGAPGVWDTGYTGDGVTIAVLDTGIDADHPDFADRIVDAVDFTDDDDVSDPVGHGTHVASIVAGDGSASDGRYTGVAPDAQLLIGKVCGIQSCEESAILAGMEWAAENGATAVNLSLGGPDTPDIDPVEQAVNDLTAEYGTLFVVAAGNAHGELTVGSPGSADAALTVGAVDRDDRLAEFSSRGPRVGDHVLKPDITAPGVDIVAARAANTEPGTPVDSDYVAASGTSMATPHVAGAVALLAQQNPGWAPERLKAALMAAAEPNADLMAHEQGAGRIDVARAVDQQVTADPASVSVGVVEWPHVETIDKTVVYANPTDEPITMELTAESTGPDGRSIDGVFTLDTSTVAIPAGGSAEVTVKVDVTGNLENGYYSGLITAVFADQRVVTPLALTREPESHVLTVDVVGRDGAPSDSILVHVTSITGDEPAHRRHVAGSSARLRLPVGEYHVEVSTDDGTSEQPERVLMVDPSRAIVEDTTVVMDARDAEAVSVSVHDETTVSDLAVFSYFRQLSDVFTGMSMIGSNFEGVYSHQYGSVSTDDLIYTEAQGVFVEGEQNDVVVGAPTKVYAYALYEEGRLGTGFDAALTADDFLKIENTLLSTGEDQFGSKTISVSNERSGFGSGVDLSVPDTFTEYITPSEHHTWRSEFAIIEQHDDGTRSVSTRESREMVGEPGTTVELAWNTAVIAPGFAPGGGWATRTDSAVDLDLPLFSGPSPNSAGVSSVDSGGTALYRGDDLIGETEEFGYGVIDGLPIERTDYRLVVEADRSGIVDVTTSMTCEWTFVSSSDDDVLPLLAVRMEPDGLDKTNHVDSGTEVAIPIKVQDVAGVVIEPVELVVEVSFDGRAWEEYPVVDGAVWVAAPEPGSVSLRVAAADDDGNTVKQTIMDAYLVG
ncbi:MAG TPA: S8 family serine peptidase [Candidatus Stackebrandtia excrementipullorum]|nr:S8 family serine peptidase [Candidatus Stackebrandtia excrementipullorum]